MGKDKVGQLEQKDFRHKKPEQSKSKQPKPKSKSKKVKAPFVLEGQCVGFIIKDSSKGDRQIKALRLAVPEQEITIKLAKPVRRTLGSTQWLGARLGVTGKYKLDCETGVTKYKATEVAVLLPAADAPPLAVPEQSTMSISTPNSPASPPQPTATILVCNKSKCCKRGGTAVQQQLERELGDRHLTDQVKIKRTGCLKQCKAGPNLVMPDKTRYSRIQAGDVPKLVEKHFGS